MPAAIPPPPIEHARADLHEALTANQAAADRGQSPPFGAGALQVLERRVRQAELAELATPHLQQTG